MAHQQRTGGPRAGLRLAQALLLGVDLTDGFDLALEALQSADRCGEGRQAVDVVDDETHREQHLGEGNPGLGEDPEIHFLSEVDRSDH